MSEAYGPAWKKSVVHFNPASEEVHADGDHSFLNHIVKLKARLRAAERVASVAQGVLTALNVGNVGRESLLHLDLRKTMIEYRQILAELDETAKGVVK